MNHELANLKAGLANLRATWLEHTNAGEFEEAEAVESEIVGILQALAWWEDSDLIRERILQDERDCPC